MRRDPLLAMKILPVRGKNYRLVFKVEGGLNYLRGNRKPHFSITVTSHRKGFPNQCWSGGADHEAILKHYPKFADIVALHLSDIDGVPMHAVENGWYWLAGALPGNAGEKYHGGQGKPEDECLEILARHLRISNAAALMLRDMIAKASENEWGWIHAKQVFEAHVENQYRRWKAEAEACIKAHDLKLFGDAWECVA